MSFGAMLRAPSGVDGDDMYWEAWALRRPKYEIWKKVHGIYHSRPDAVLYHAVRYSRATRPDDLFTVNELVSAPEMRALFGTGTVLRFRVDLVPARATAKQIENIVWQPDRMNLVKL